MQTDANRNQFFVLQLWNADPQEIYSIADTTSESITGYVNGPKALKYQEYIFNATSDSAFNVECVRVHREAVTADSIVRDNNYPKNRGRRLFDKEMAPEYNFLQDSTPTLVYMRCLMVTSHKFLLNCSIRG